MASGDTEAFESMLAEMRRHSEAKEHSERFENEETSILDHIRGIITEDDMRRWKMVESLISGECAKSKLVTYPDHIRAKLMEI